MKEQTFAVWAPVATERVDLVLDYGEVAMSCRKDGWWTASAPARDGTRYAYRIDGSEELPDPRSARLPDGVHGRSAVFDTGAHEWSDAGWRGIELSRAVVYELHIGTFTPQGTLDAAIQRLDHVALLGVTLVELMPVAAFPGRFGWGYDGVAPYAVHEPYGGPAALQRFVDAAHALGLGVCLDVVYNHLGPSGNYLSRFGPYFTDVYRTPWGEAVNLDRPGSDQVRQYLIENALWWLRDFHIDALRLDAVHELHDARALTILEELSARVDQLADLGQPAGWPRQLIAESDRNDPRTVTERAPAQGRRPGGLGLAAQWADDVHHALHVLLTGETQGYYADFAALGVIEKVVHTPFFHDGTYSTFRGRRHGRPVDPGGTPGWRFVVALQTHDQVGNRAMGDRLSFEDAGRLACGAALLLTSPYTPMLFMGEEWGASTPWQYFADHEEPELAEAIRNGRQAEFAEHGWGAQVPDPQDEATVQRSKLDWGEVQQPRHARLMQWYAALLALRRERPELHDGDLDAVWAEHDAPAQTVQVERHGVRVLVNLADQVRSFEVPSGLTLTLAWDPWTALAGGRVNLAAESACVLVPPTT